jgi:hypothetical protein
MGNNVKIKQKTGRIIQVYDSNQKIITLVKIEDISSILITKRNKKRNYRQFKNNRKLNSKPEKQQ